MHRVAAVVPAPEMALGSRIPRYTRADLSRCNQRQHQSVFTAGRKLRRCHCVRLVPDRFIFQCAQTGLKLVEVVHLHSAIATRTRKQRAYLIELHVYHDVPHAVLSCEARRLAAP